MTARDREGGCLCGAVRFAARDVSAGYGACHCEMCRRWTGAALLAVSVPQANVAWTGEAHIRTLQSSDWAERAWCQRCGSGLYYHVTREGPMSQTIEMPIGLFDDANGFEMKSEIYIDHKPDSFTFAGEHARLTRAETLKRLGIEELDE